VPLLILHRKGHKKLAGGICERASDLLVHGGACCALTRQDA
jgi:hypothetical protein